MILGCLPVRDRANRQERCQTEQNRLAYDLLSPPQPEKKLIVSTKCVCRDTVKASRVRKIYCISLRVRVYASKAFSSLHLRGLWLTWRPWCGPSWWEMADDCRLLTLRQISWRWVSAGGSVWRSSWAEGETDEGSSNRDGKVIHVARTILFYIYIYMIMMSWCDAKFSGMFYLLSRTSTFIYLISIKPQTSFEASDKHMYIMKCIIYNITLLTS